MSNTGVAGNYYLRIKFGDVPIGVSNGSMNNCNIITSLDRFLPYYKLSLNDSLGIMTHKMPADSKFDKVKLSFDQIDYVEREFKIARETPTEISQNQSEYVTQGLLNLKGLFSPDRMRGFGGKSVKDIVTQIAEEIGCDDVDIGKSADIVYPIYQPNCSNSKLLNYLKEKLGAYCYIVFRGNKNILIFKTIDELLQNPSAAEYVYSDDLLGEDTKTAYNFKSHNNAGILRDAGIYAARYSYYDYNTGTHVQSEVSLDTIKMLSLSDYYMVTDEDKSLGFTTNLGGGEQFSAKTKMEGILKKRINGLVTAWIDIDGDYTREPGDIINLKFVYGASSDIFSYQFNGYWLVDRVIQSYGDLHITRLLLKRPGLTTNAKDVSFLKPERSKRTD